VEQEAARGSPGEGHGEEWGSGGRSRVWWLWRSGAVTPWPLFFVFPPVLCLMAEPLPSSSGRFPDGDWVSGCVCSVPCQSVALVAFHPLSLREIKHNTVRPR
jgi:hypothetical protein